VFLDLCAASQFSVVLFCHFSVILFDAPFFLITFTPTVAQPARSYINTRFSYFLLLFCFIILPDVDSMHFDTYFATCETSSIKNLFVLATEVAENVAHIVFRQPFVIQTC